MKNLIIIILIGLSFACKGQNDSIWIQKGLTGDSIKVGAANTITTGGFYLGSTTITDSRVNILDRNVTIDLLLEYKKECLRDTVFMYLNQYGSVLRSINKINNLVMIGFEHKRPTFPDFLNWIEKRKTK